MRVSVAVSVSVWAPLPLSRDMLMCCCVVALRSVPFNLSSPFPLSFCQSLFPVSFFLFSSLILRHPGSRPFFCQSSLLSQLVSEPSSLSISLSLFSARVSGGGGVFLFLRVTLALRNPDQLLPGPFLILTFGRVRVTLLLFDFLPGGLVGSEEVRKTE